MKRTEVDRHRALRRSNAVMLGGTAAAVGGVLIQEFWGLVGFLLLLIGILAVIWGFVYAHEHCCCARCEKFLGESFRVPGKLPDFCPHCGERV